MSQFYDDLVEGFNGILESQNGKHDLKTTIYSIPEVKRYTTTEIKTIRKNMGLTQALFAAYMGVSKKTVEAWERGINKPTGPACRLLSVLENNKTLML